MNILLVEPDVLSAKLYASVLEKPGFKSIIVSSAQQALDCLDKMHIDLVILELDIPAHNGLEFLYEFCTYSDWMHIPVLVHSTQPASKFNNMLVSWAELNVYDYLYKPDTSLAELQRAVQLAPTLKS